MLQSKPARSAGAARLSIELIKRRLERGACCSPSQGSTMAANSSAVLGRCSGSSAVARTIAASMCRHASAFSRSSGLKLALDKMLRRSLLRVSS